jgi:hypothetical protein
MLSGPSRHVGLRVPKGLLVNKGGERYMVVASNKRPRRRRFPEVRGAHSRTRSAASWIARAASPGERRPRRAA